VGHGKARPTSMLTVLRDANECRGGEYMAREGKKTEKNGCYSCPASR
jgi:hypothetical protein